MSTLASNLSNSPTIRAITGAAVGTRLDARATALIVIDFQNEYFIGKLLIPDGLAALRNANRLIAMADQHGMPVFHIQQWSPATRPLFTQNSVMAEIHPDVQRASHHAVIRKNFASAFASTDLQEQLLARGIKTLIISGLMTNNCVAATAFDGAAHGYQNVIASDASATRAIDVWDGSVIDHKDLHRAVLTGLSDAVAEIRTTNAILELTIES